MSKYGHFSDSGTEYIVTDPNTPKPWLNFLSNRKYCALVSATGGGYSFVYDTKYNRVTREVPGDSITQDRPGRYLFIRDQDSGEVWSTNWQPIMGKYDSWESVHGLGYTKIANTTNLIYSEIEYFVPLDDTLEVWRIKVKNLDTRVRRLSLHTYVEWVLGSFYRDLTDRNFDVFFNNVHYEKNTIYGTKTRGDRPDRVGDAWGMVAFLSGDTDFDGWECSKSAFVGQNRYLSNPQGLFANASGNNNAIGEDAVGVLKKDLVLKPKQSLSINVVLGVAKSKSEADKLVKKYHPKKKVDSEYIRVAEQWSDFSSRLKVVTPDHNFDVMVNYWTKYQAWMASVWGESDSLYIGGGDIGFRDECQHIYGILPLDQKLAESVLVELLQNQYLDGRVNHNWNRATGKGVETNHSDDCQWLVMAIINYLEETADFSFLAKKISYYDSPENDKSDEKSVFEHLLRALDNTLYHVSPNGIPLRRAADWNDALSGGVGLKAESLMVANHVCWNISRLVPLIDRLSSSSVNLKTLNQTEKSLSDLLDKYSHIYQRIRSTTNHYFWDGAWYIRATDNDGKFIGSHKNREGKIYLDGQTWAVMSGVADEKRGLTAMDSVWKHLDTAYGPCIFLPAYSHLSKELGVISQFAPGTKENGTIFYHLVAWSVIAECILGRGDKAYEIWKKTCPINRGEDPDLYQVEPYVYSEFVFGPQNPHFGKGSYSWMTGSAAWFLRACTDWILGVRPTYEGLFIDPCIPKHWKSFSIKRVFRGKTYHIEVLNPKGVNKGVVRVEVNGEVVKGSLVTHQKSSNIDVKVLLG
ncbi:MAG: hypothetical protein A3A61_04085 [Candidatus Woykebacteria bacterium RIFCSPLOWO2_01_FULL_43_14]|uniref:Uncharacterized protein n=1 Tax=Candidatus Woykebacteria bacterium RIFCSPLOWO2_01_FULL_43_14 TaxID=1802605 RepID=A0A1G1WY05_9BACT|nr:MAG: hypothetical protein A3A61_04085 [Candidatus Woykebacteria bacterium RIFCSPLOWO2_01_FULL_43_14]